MGSTRLPGKVLKPLAGAPLLQRIVERVKRSKYIDRIVLATTTKAEDYELANLAKILGISYFRGSENDILTRLSGVVEQFEPEVVVSLTGDNPLIDPVLIDDMIEFFLEGGYDYVASTHMHHSDLWKAERTFPVGVSVQVVDADVLMEANREVTGTWTRGNGLFSIYNCNDNRYKLGAFQAEGHYKEWKYPEMRFTVDTPEDYELMMRIYEELYPDDPNFSTLKAIQLVLDKGLQSINSDVQQRIAFREK